MKVKNLSDRKKRNGCFLSSGFGKDLYRAVFGQTAAILYLFVALAMLITGAKEKNRKTDFIGEVLMIGTLLALIVSMLFYQYASDPIRNLEPDFLFMQDVDYQKGEHQMSLSVDQVSSQYKVKLLIDGTGIYFKDASKPKSFPYFIPWNKFSKCIRGGLGFNVITIKMPIKSTNTALTLNHWGLIHPLCAQKGVPLFQ